MVGKIINLTSYQANLFLLPRHYSGRKPVISKAFGWVVDDWLQAVITFGKPASPAVCKSICGDKWADNVYELNRLCREESFDLPLSMFVSAVLRKLKTENWIIISYSDTAMHHNGYIYQACNFMFIGKTKERTDPYTGENKHARHYTQVKPDCNIRVLRTSKNRYLYFCTNNKALKRKWINDLRYPILPYPKEENKNYVLGEYIKPILIDKTTKENVEKEGDRMNVKDSIDMINLIGKEICTCASEHYDDLVESLDTVKDAVTWKEFDADDLGERYDFALPENGEEILTYDVSGYIRMDVFCDGGEDGYYLASGNELCEDVTHWMRLPEVPEE